MAKKKDDSPKTIMERTYVVPLRSETLKVPPFRKAEKASKALREFIQKHMKSQDVKIGRYLNMKLWEHGIKNPPGKIKVVASKNDKGVVYVELVGAPKEEIKVEEKKPAKKASKETVLEAQVKEVKEEKAEESKRIEKEEIKELKKEQKEHHAPQKHAPKQPAIPKDSGDMQHPPAPRHE